HQPHAGRDRGRRRQGRERLDAAVHHPVQHPQAGEWPGLDPPGPVEDTAAVGARRGGGQPDPDLHVRSFPALAQIWCARAGSWYGSTMRAGIILLVVAAVLATPVVLLWAFQRRLLYVPTPGTVP